MQIHPSNRASSARCPSIGGRRIYAGNGRAVRAPIGQPWKASWEMFAGPSGTLRDAGADGRLWTWWMRVRSWTRKCMDSASGRRVSASADGGDDDARCRTCRIGLFDHRDSFWRFTPNAVSLGGFIADIVIHARISSVALMHILKQNGYHRLSLGGIIIFKIAINRNNFINNETYNNTRIAEHKLFTKIKSLAISLNFSPCLISSHFVKAKKQIKFN